MTRKKHQGESRKPHHPEGGAGAFDLDLAVASHDLDATADREWFIRHPGITQRIRPATVLEQTAHNLPPGTETLVFLLWDGTQGRIFLSPEV